MNAQIQDKPVQCHVSRGHVQSNVIYNNTALVSNVCVSSELLFVYVSHVSYFKFIKINHCHLVSLSMSTEK